MGKKKHISKAKEVASLKYHGKDIEEIKKVSSMFSVVEHLLSIQILSPRVISDLVCSLTTLTLTGSMKTRQKYDH